MIERRKFTFENGLWNYNLATDNYYFSPGICKIFDLDQQDLDTHDNFSRWIYPEDVDDYTHLFNEGIKSQQPFALNFRIILNDGTIKEIEENVNFLTDEVNHVVSYYGIVSDVSAFTKFQNEKQDSYTLINSILRTLPNLIFVKNIDAGFRFTFVNDHFASFYGLTPADIIGKYDRDISTPEQAKACYRTDDIASKHDITLPIISVEEIPISKKTTKYMQTIKFAHIINGTNYLICSAMDISDLVKARQKAEESDKLKSAFLCTISHEIRTPMNSIMGFAQLISEAKDRHEMNIFCEKIKSNGEQLLHLITDIVYLAMLETDNSEFTSENTDIESLFAQIKRQNEKQIKAKHLDFIYTPHDCPCNVYTNKDGITELMKLFLDNATKFTEKGSISMGYDLEDKEMRIWVKDTGIGIDKKDKKNVFKRFVKLNDFTTGTGIGLYIAQKITKLMKGKIGIESEIGKGTLAWVKLPLHHNP